MNDCCCYLLFTNSKKNNKPRTKGNENREIAWECVCVCLCVCLYVCVFYIMFKITKENTSGINTNVNTKRRNILMCLHVHNYGTFLIIMKNKFSIYSVFLPRVVFIHCHGWYATYSSVRFRSSGYPHMPFARKKIRWN